MRSYWLRIGFGAIVIFAIGFGVISAGRKVKSSIESNKDFTVPLGAFIPFNFEGTKAGTLRSITIRRSAPHQLSGFNLHLRTADSVVFAKLESCNLSVNDARHIDERTSFICLPSDSGYQAFGEVTVDFRLENDNRTLVRPLLLPDAAIADMQRRQSDPVAAKELADSIAAEVRQRVRPLRQQYDDSVEAARLDRRSAEIKARADSLRARGKAGIPAPAATPVPPKPPSP